MKRQTQDYIHLCAAAVVSIVAIILLLDQHTVTPAFAQEQEVASTQGSVEQGDGESPAGEFVSEQQMRKAKATGEGYFGYHFRILRGQGDNIAGGRYDYVINGNMIAGFALIAWPVKYAETAVNTVLVNHAGIVYQKDLGPSTDALVRDIARFNPDKSWQVVDD